MTLRPARATVALVNAIRRLRSPSLRAVVASSVSDAESRQACEQVTVARRPLARSVRERRVRAARTARPGAVRSIAAAAIFAMLGGTGAGDDEALLSPGGAGAGDDGALVSGADAGGVADGGDAGGGIVDGGDAGGGIVDGGDAGGGVADGGDAGGGVADGGDAGGSAAGGEAGGAATGAEGSGGGEPVEPEGPGAGTVDPPGGALAKLPAARTARAAFRRPPVTVTDRSAKIGSTEDSSTSRSWGTVSPGARASASAATPVTCGVAIEVPLR